MAVKKPITIYSGLLKQIQSGDVTTGESSATIAKSIAKAAESQGALDNSIADRGQSLGRRAGSVATIDKSVALRGESVAKKAESQGALDNSLADHAESEAKRGLSIARRVELRYIDLAEVRANEMSLDTVDLGSSRGSFFGIGECIDFAPGVAGTVWLSFALPQGPTNKWVADITPRIHYNCNGDDTGKTVTFNTSWWLLGENVTPVLATPTGLGSTNITTASSNMGKFNTYPLVAFAAADLSPAGFRIVLKLSRSASDTYTGTVQVQSVVFIEG